VGLLAAVTSIIISVITAKTKLTLAKRRIISRVAIFTFSDSLKVATATVVTVQIAGRIRVVVCMCLIGIIVLTAVTVLKALLVGLMKKMALSSRLEVLAKLSAEVFGTS